MDYNKLYFKIISSRKSRSNKIEGEIHHIVPKCLGGSNDKENLIKLTYREHLVCHWILTKIYPNNKKIQYAFFKLNNYLGPKASRNYERIRLRFIEDSRIRMTLNNPMKGKISPMRGKKHSPETILKISNKAKDLFKDPNYRKKHREGVSAGVSGEKHPFFGKKHTDESIKKASITKGCRPFNVYEDEKFIGQWWSQSKCCRDLNLKSVGNLNCSLKRGTRYGKYTFKYVI